MRSRISAIVISALIFISCLLGAYFYENDGKEPENDKPEAFTQTDILAFKDIAYGPEDNQRLDLHLPLNGKKETGLVLFIHGGGWKGGDKASVYRKLSVFNANTSYATATMNYRFINDGKTTVEDIIDDITLALDKIKTFAAGYSVNITRVILSGHSAGGHLSLLYAYKHRDISPIEPVGVFASAPVPDLANDLFFTNNSIGDEAKMCRFISMLVGEEFTPETRASKKALLGEYSAINYVSADTVPTIILHGNKDKIAPFDGSVKLSEKLAKYKVKHKLVVFENTGHGLKNPEKRKYASELLLKCAEEWFN